MGGAWVSTGIPEAQPVNRQTEINLAGPKLKTRITYG